MAAEERGFPAGYLPQPRSRQEALAWARELIDLANTPTLGYQHVKPYVINRNILLIIPSPSPPTATTQAQRTTTNSKSTSRGEWGTVRRRAQ